MKTKYAIPATVLALSPAAFATGSVPSEVTTILTNIGAVNTAVAAVAGVVIITWLAFRLAKRAIR